jgi:DNA-directed RNA polymerase specialized sigma24 family protein
MYFTTDWSSFYMMNLDDIRAFVAHAIPSARGPDLDDAVQDCFCYIYEKELLEKYIPGRGDFFSYIYSIVQNFCCNAIRKYKASAWARTLSCNPSGTGYEWSAFGDKQFDADGYIREIEDFRKYLAQIPDPATRRNMLRVYRYFEAKGMGHRPYATRTDRVPYRLIELYKTYVARYHKGESL